MLLEPIAFVIMLIFKREFDISGLYGIREMDLLYYLFFGLIVVPAESLCDVLLLNAAPWLARCRVPAAARSAVPGAEHRVGAGRRR